MVGRGTTHVRCRRIFLEGMEECFILKPLVSKGLSHSVNLGLAFLARYILRLSCHGNTNTLEPISGDKISKTVLVDGNCLDFENRKSGKTWRATSRQEILTQAWRIPWEKLAINILKDVTEENIGVYAKEHCSIPLGMGKYIPEQTNQDIQGDVLVKINEQTVTGLILPEIVYRVKRKLGCIFIENHNSTSLDLQRGQTMYNVYGV